MGLRGRKPGPGGAMRNLTIRFSLDEIEWLAKTAKEEIRPIADLVRYIIAQYRKEQEERTW